MRNHLMLCKTFLVLFVCLNSMCLREQSWLTPGHSRRGSIESELSIQGKETDYVRDTSDTERSSGVEYEPVTEPEDEGPLDWDSSGQSDNEIIATKVIEVKVGDDGDLEFADSEQTESEGSDSEIDLYDYWECAQCRAVNNNPLYRYCEKCYKVRKNFFPPRPRKRKRVAEVPRTNSVDSGVESVFSQDTLSQPSQGIPDSQSSELQSNSQGPDSQSTDFQVNSQSILDSQSTELQPNSQSIPDSQSSDLSQQTAQGIPDSQSTDFPPNSQVIPNSQSSETELSQSTPTQPDIPTDPQPTNLTKDLILTRLLKRRAESADRNRKRIRVDYSDSDSDEPRSRKAKSADPEVPKSDKLESNLCIICYSEPKSAVFVHGRIAHICCCYECANKVWRKAKRCPQCNCKVSNVLKVL